jgi:hypothetical protein
MINCPHSFLACAKAIVTAGVCGKEKLLISRMGSKKQRKREGLRSQYPLQVHAPHNLKTSH